MCAGTTPGDADIEYIRLARKLEFYGIDLHVRAALLLYYLFLPSHHITLACAVHLKMFDYNILEL